MAFGGRAVNSVNSCQKDHKVSFAKRKMVVILGAWCQDELIGGKLPVIK
jgi:hypothetical protein